MAIKVNWKSPKQILILIIIIFIIAAFFVKAYVVEITNETRNGILIVFIIAILLIATAKWLPGLFGKKSSKEANLDEAEIIAKAWWEKKRNVVLTFAGGEGTKRFYDRVNPSFGFLFQERKGTALGDYVAIIIDHTYTPVHWLASKTLIDLDDLWRRYSAGHPGSPSNNPLEIKYPILEKPGTSVVVNTSQMKEQENDIISKDKKK